MKRVVKLLFQGLGVLQQSQCARDDERRFQGDEDLAQLSIQCGRLGRISAVECGQEERFGFGIRLAGSRQGELRYPQGIELEPLCPQHRPPVGDALRHGLAF